MPKPTQWSSVVGRICIGPGPGVCHVCLSSKALHTQEAHEQDILTG